MSTLTADPPATSHAATPPAAAHVQPTFAGVVRGEWIKLLSLRSTWFRRRLRHDWRSRAAW